VFLFLCFQLNFLFSGSAALLLFQRESRIFEDNSTLKPPPLFIKNHMNENADYSESREFSVFPLPQNALVQLSHKQQTVESEKKLAQNI
jgi:hypothetical protein